MKIWIFLLSASLLLADSSLYDLIEKAQNSDTLQAKKLELESVSLQYKSTFRSYLPSLNLGGSATYVDRQGGFDAKKSYVASLNAGVVLFDGFKRENTLKKLENLSKSKEFELNDAKKEISLRIIHLATQSANIDDELDSIEYLKNQLNSQLNRLNRFLDVGLASKDVVLRLNSELEDVEFKIEGLKYQRESIKSELEMIAEAKIDSKINMNIKEPTELEFIGNDYIESLKALKLSKESESLAKDAKFYPTIKIEDELSYFKFVNDPMADMRINRQNKIMAIASINLLDFSASSLASQATKAEAMSISKNISYATRSLKRDFELAKHQVARVLKQISSATMAYSAASATYESIKRKYDSGIVDYIDYLDALHLLHNSKNRLDVARRELQLAYAVYYYKAGLDPKEYILND